MKPSFAIVASLLLLARCGDAAPNTAGKTAPKTATKPAKPPVKPLSRPPVPGPRPVLPPKTEVVAAPVAAAPAQSGPKTWALLVGVGHYANEQISSLRFPAKDALGLRDALTDPALGAIPASQIMVLTDDEATRDKINGAVEAFLKPNVRAGDTVVVFLAGHGISKGAGPSAKSYLLPTDVTGLTTMALENSAVSLRAFSDQLGELPAAQFMVFVDACREDPTPGRGVKGNGLSDVIARGIAVVPQDPAAQSATFFACSVGQRAFEDVNYGHGVFTNWILQGLREGGVAQKPDGAVDMGRLSSYVSAKVKDWAAALSASGNFEVSQTPQLVATSLTQPLVFLRVKGDLSKESEAAPIALTAPRLWVSASPADAQIALDGAPVGIGSALKIMPAGGDFVLTVGAAGYTPITRTVKALGGYENQVDVQLKASDGAVAAGGNAADENGAVALYNRALQAEAREQFEIAEQGYTAAMGADAKFAPAYEALLRLHSLQFRNTDALSDALRLVANVPRSAHSLSLLSRAYREFALKGAGTDNAATSVSALGAYGMPKNSDDAAQIAVRAAGEALALGAGDSEANLAQGYALAALDEKGKNKRAALAAFGRAAFSNPLDADNHLGLGYGIRFYASQLKKEDEKRAETGRAIAALNEAVKLRPNFYEAHRELAFCYIALDDTPAALRECRLARSNRGGANDVNEIAGVEVAMAALHEKVAENSTGDKKTANEAASKGYTEDAKDSARGGDLKDALAILSAAGVGGSLRSFVPAELRPLLDIRATIQSRITTSIPGLGGLRLPF